MEQRKKVVIDRCEKIEELDKKNMSSSMSIRLKRCSYKSSNQSHILKDSHDNIVADIKQKLDMNRVCKKL